jgi:hypothetical protein
LEMACSPESFVHRAVTLTELCLQLETACLNSVCQPRV